MPTANRQQIAAGIRPYRDVIIFMVTLIVANYFWKFTVQGDEETTGAIVTWFGMDVTAFFDRVAQRVAYSAYRVILCFRDTVFMPRDNVIAFASGNSTCIIWACAGVKQMFIWMCLILTVHGGWKHKWWYIPAGWVICDLFNILRIAAIAMIIEFHPERFELFHSYIFKYMFYGMMFLLWVLFVNRIRGDISASESGTAVPESIS